MNLLSFLPWRKKIPALAGRKPHADDEPPREEEDRPRGCGWFDSSHDLHRGLCVQEHASPDTLAQELPLANWLELQLSGWRVTHPA